MEHLLSVSDPMIIFTSPDLAPNIASLRSHAPHTTKVVSMDLKETLMATKYSGGEISLPIPLLSRSFSKQCVQ